ncbi:MAG TPA: glycoside hydrolase family 2 TIM barrel-domain containing protein [Amnibacterium sp.]|jgi:beta-galactosidase/beta-glucuronidase|uniref:glycoside hydrolase family 2 protein n=1 Tax=Amnibacterium sp. TaxID=1872496 RepID=UPI002F93D552
MPDAAVNAAELHPRPQLVRSAWKSLDGSWAFRHDDGDEGATAGWTAGFAADRTITVPFPPESPASGIGDTGYHPVVWYSRKLTAADLTDAGRSADAPRVLLHLGAVDYRASVWLDGALLGTHEGGHTPFSFDITEHVAEGDAWTLVVRAEDDPLDVGQPRGKQDWLPDPHVIWYHRTTGIWQPVWLEAVPALAVRTLHWTTDLPTATVRLEVALDHVPADGTTCRVVVTHDGRHLAESTTAVARDRFTVVLAVPEQANGQGYERLLWSPEHPVLLDAQVTVAGPAGTDVIDSYLGLRSAAVDRGAFLLNDRPVYLRSVLEQGYWPESHLAAPSAQALRDEVQLIRDLGFNSVRIHQKFEDPRFLYWTDRLGVLVWSEAPGAYESSPTAITRTVREWLEVLDRDRSHPSIVTWVPLNESWGVQHIAATPALRSYARGLAELTRAIDPTRPVISNDGWEHVDSDLLTVHDYEWRPDVVRERYGSAGAFQRELDGIGPAGRRILLDGSADGLPIVLSEFGGIRFSPGGAGTEDWGYSTAADADDLRERLSGLLEAVHASPLLAGFCYTQLTDTLQEANGLLTADREPKLPMEQLRAIITGGDGA